MSAITVVPLSLSPSHSCASLPLSLSQLCLSSYHSCASLPLSLSSVRPTEQSTGKRQDRFAQKIARREKLTWKGEVSHGRQLGGVLQGGSTDTIHMQRTFKFSCDTFWLMDTRASCGSSSSACGSSSSAQLVQIREFGFFEVHDVGCGRGGQTAGGRQTHGSALARFGAWVEACVSTFTFSFRKGRHFCPHIYL
jgi:hypothetical protein